MKKRTSRGTTIDHRPRLLLRRFFAVAASLFANYCSAQSSSNKTCFSSKTELRGAVEEYMSNMGNSSPVAKKYGYPIGTWCVSSVEDFSFVFAMFPNTTFTDDLSTWDTSSVTKMDATFYNCEKCNPDISGWDVSSVASMSQLFYNAKAFNSDLSGWSVGKLTETVAMFANAAAFNSDLFSWNVASVSSMAYMFQNATSFDQNLASWNTSKVTDMTSMFEGATSFKGATSFDGDLLGRTWDVRKVLSMELMFKNASSFNQDLCQWGSRLSSNTNVSHMFANTSCPDVSDPVLTANPRGPFCHSCQQDTLPGMPNNVSSPTSPPSSVAMTMPSRTVTPTTPVLSSAHWSGPGKTAKLLGLATALLLYQWFTYW